MTSSLQSYLQSLSIFRSSGCNDKSIEVALVLGAIGQLHLKKGYYVEATVTLQHCMRIFESIGKFRILREMVHLLELLLTHLLIVTYTKACPSTITESKELGPS